MIETREELEDDRSGNTRQIGRPDARVWRKRTAREREVGERRGEEDAPRLAGLTCHGLWGRPGQTFEEPIGRHPRRRRRRTTVLRGDGRRTRIVAGNTTLHSFEEQLRGRERSIMNPKVDPIRLLEPSYRVAVELE